MQLDPVAQKEAARISAADVKRARAFEAMVNTEGWKLFQDLLNYHINSRMTEVIGPTSDALRSEHTKGTVFGLMMARDIPGASIASVKQVVAETPVEEKE